MTKSIRNLFQKNIELISLSDKAVIYLRKQNFYKALSFTTQTIDNVLSIVDDVLSNQTYFNENDVLIDINYINKMLHDLLEAQENKDYILLADLFEIQFIPFVIKLQEYIISKEEFVSDEELYLKNINSIADRDAKLGEQLRLLNPPLELLEMGYSVEYTSSGLLTLALYDDNNRKYYMHSNGHVFREAGELAREWFSNDTSEFIIYGLGFGYHIMELLELDNSITIQVYESDINIIQLACTFSNLHKMLDENRVQIIYDPLFKKVSYAIREIKDNMKYIIHYPSLRNIKDSNVREQFEDYFVLYSSVNNQLHSLNNNFRKNINHYDAYIDNLREEFHGKDLYIVAAGPSLDNNYLQLKELNSNSIILATGTVMKKLLKAGIKPDYAIIIDANDLVYQQVEGIEDEQIPLLFLSTVYYKIPENYRGYKYLVCQEGYKKSEEYAQKNGYQLYKTGGSVSTIALDIGIEFECKRIIFLGLDLAFTNEKDHASEISSINNINTVEFRHVEDINGNKVATGKNLDIYRKWIENRIKTVKNIEIIDATEGGAQIKGMKIKFLEEIIHCE